MKKLRSPDVSCDVFSLKPDPLPIGSMYAIYGNMDPINIPQMLAYRYIYIPYMDPMDW